MITDHHMPAFLIQIGSVVNFPFHFIHQSQHQRITTQPAVHDEITATGQVMIDHCNRDQ
jgi:hypothetical protein